jgi:hypothetical protein
MRKGTITNRTIARDMMNMLRPDSILNKNVKERQKNATKKALEFRKNNPEKASEIALKGGNATFKKKTGIHAETFEVRSERAKKSYKEGKGMAKLTKEQRSKIGKSIGKKNLVGEIICELCGRKTNKGNYKQFHGDNCREKNIIEFIELLPNKFTKGIAKEISIKYEIATYPASISLNFDSISSGRNGIPYFLIVPSSFNLSIRICRSSGAYTSPKWRISINSFMQLYCYC